MRKAISPLISSVLLIAVAFGIGAIIAPWSFNLATDVSNETSTSTLNEVVCRSAAYDFDTSYGRSGINHSFSTTNDHVWAKITNTGTINLYDFSMEIEFTSSSGLDLRNLEINSSFQKTEALPLKPGRTAILKANITENLNGTLTSVKVLNAVCPTKFVRQTL